MPFNIKQGASLPVIPKSSVSNVITKIQQGDEAGETFGSTKYTSYPAGSQYLAVNSETPDVRILVPHFYPSLCPGISGTKSATNPLSQSLEQLYNALAGSAYDSTAFNRADLGKHIIISEGFLCAIDMIDRFLDNFNIQEYGNKGPIAFRRSQGFSSTHYGSPISFTDVVSARNELVPEFNKLLVPSSIPWLQKHRYLVRHIFADDMHKKTGFIIPRLHVLYTSLTGTQNNVAPMSRSVWNPENSTNDIIDFIFQLKVDITDYVASAFYKELSPFLWRAMLQSNGPKVDKPYQITEYTKTQAPSTVDILFDYRVIQMIRNADYIGIPFNLRPNSSSGNEANMNIFEDTKMDLKQGQIGANGTNRYGIAVMPYMAHKGVDSTTPATNLRLDNITFDRYCDPNQRWWDLEIVPGISKKRHINAEDWPSSDEAIYYALNCNVLVEAFPTSYVTTECFMITSCGDTTFMYFSSYTIDNSIAGNVRESNFVPMIAVGTLANNTIGGFLDCFKLVGSLNQAGDTKYLLAYTGYLCCPVITISYWNAGNANHIYLEDLFIDKDNIITFSDTVLYKLHNYIMFNTMLCNALQVKGVTDQAEKPGKQSNK